MDGVGRNAPCPCGSGRKFKKCCLTARGADLGAFTSGERESALAALSRFAERPEFAAAHARAEDEYWDEVLDGLSDEEVERLDELAEDDEQSAFHTWFYFDHRLEDGTTLVDVFLVREGSRLRAGEREYLRRMRAARFGLYEVVDVRPEEGLRLVDLWTDEPVWVRERAATRQLVRWDLLAARLMPGQRGELVMDGRLYPYPASAREDVLESLRDAYRESKADDPASFFKDAAPLFHALWLDFVALPPLPTPVTVEGDPVVLARVVFDVEDGAAARAALASHPDLRAAGADRYAWYEPMDGEGRRRLLGLFVLDEQQLVFETVSEARAARGRGFLEGLTGRAVRHVTTECRELADALGGEEPVAEAPDVPAEVEGAAAAAYYERYYRDWPDTPIPALGGRTPREAAGEPESRAALVALLKDFESRAERQRRAGRPAYDFGRLWPELGLPRPE